MLPQSECKNECWGKQLSLVIEIPLLLAETKMEKTKEATMGSAAPTGGPWEDSGEKATGRGAQGSFTLLPSASLSPLTPQPTTSLHPSRIPSWGSDETHPMHLASQGSHLPTLVLPASSDGSHVITLVYDKLPGVML